ncbi:pyrroline-5-carboxylate reductase [Ferroacidibacillus organovorans]|uniref:Pyrroline-5-carboxylate reductase n=1 Tax=Ferroacidibacillus organovorans TaxID=1765683 RepID=A0A101XPA5_9BACL|nr:pyrroline-5-carboxylate reductase [Ferroacidibacillus organovorans]KUO94959.1 hypothetical protein ATW55_04810 [Ferroacidibacillus organovorans]
MKALGTLHLGFLGAGAIAEALIRGLTTTGVARPEQIHVTNRGNRSRLEELQLRYGVNTYALASDALAHVDVILICTKPRDVPTALTTIAPFVPRDVLYVSIAAGVSIATIESSLTTAKGCLDRSRKRIVRAMPNTSSVVLCSATGYALSHACTPEDEAVVRTLLSAVGRAYPLDESLLNAVTGLSGSGPAYVYYLAEAMTQGGIDVGLDPHTATELVVETLFGAAQMLRERVAPPTALRKQVTSPNGTTMAGLAVLDAYSFTDAVRAAIKRATERSAELGDEFTREAQES